jgi:eukaryotic-like serine/threonine-protein kinase
MMVSSSLRLDERIGAGGMGSVWRAEDLARGRRVAVKLIAGGVARHSDSALARFAREADIAAAIDSPHMTEVYGHGVAADGTPFIVMELLEGETLQAKLARERCLPLREAAIVVRQTAEVLARAHALGVVHRDIKPANLFLLRSGPVEPFVKVLDFGIARPAASADAVTLTQTGALVGTPLYMSPEQLASAHDVDGRADLWSLAVVFYHLLTGQPSFQGDTLGQVMMAVLQRDYRPPRRVRPGLPRGVDAFFARAFAADVDARFQDAGELCAALDRLLEGRPEAARRRRRPLALGDARALVVAVGLASLGHVALGAIDLVARFAAQAPACESSERCTTPHREATMHAAEGFPTAICRASE